MELIEEQPVISTRPLAGEAGVSQFVHYKNKAYIYIYHVQKVQALEPTDFPRSTIYYQWLLQQCRERSNFLNRILFTDQAGFTRNAVS